MSLSNSEVIAHYFSTASDRRATDRSNSGTLWYNGPVLYSYKTPIGVLDDGVFITTNKRYSVTTSSHQNKSYAAAKDHGVQLVSVTAEELRKLADDYLLPERSSADAVADPKPEPPYPWCSQPQICTGFGYCRRSCGD